MPYDTAYLSGYVVEHYQVVLVDAAKQAREEMHAEADAAVFAAGPGRHAAEPRDLPHVYSGETFKHILVPVWLLTYTYGRRVFQVVANGYTGTIAGQYPKSPWKIAAAIGLGVLLAIIVLVLSQQ